MLDFVALRIQFSSLPISLSATAATLQVRPDRFLGVIAYDEYPVHNPVEIGVWYTLEMKVQKNPYEIVFNVYNDSGTLPGTQTVTNVGFSYADIRYVCLQVWSTGLNPVYDVDWLKIVDGVYTVEWSKTFSGATAVDGWPYIVRQTIDGGYALAGRTTVDGSSNLFWLQEHGGVPVPGGGEDPAQQPHRRASRTCLLEQPLLRVDRAAGGPEFVV